MSKKHFTKRLLSALVFAQLSSLFTLQRKPIEYSYFHPRSVTQCARLRGTLKSLNLCKRKITNYNLLCSPLGNGVWRLFIVSLMGTRIFSGALAIPHTSAPFLLLLKSLARELQAVTIKF